MASIKRLIQDIEKISEKEKCLTCQCFFDTLMEFREVLEKKKVDADLKERLSKLINKSKVTHNCLGCDPCLPVPVSNVLSETLGVSACSCGPSCKLPPVKRTRKMPSWPNEQGEYIVGDKGSSVAISSLGSDELPEVISEKLGHDMFSIMGKTHTENIGIEKVIKNTISNPNIRFIILCGKDTKGHMSGQSLLSLMRHGVNHEKKIIGSHGQRPTVKNLELSEIEHFRAQIQIIDLIGTEAIQKVKETVSACREKDPGKFDRALSIRRVAGIEARKPQRLVLDPSGFLIIYPKKEEGRIYLEHYLKDGTLNEIIYGEDPVLIASTAVDLGLVSRLDHAAYLGRELEKAYLSMCCGFEYIQDSAPGKE